MMSVTWLTIGKITGVHGLAGNLKVWSYAESLETFSPGRQVRLREEGGDTRDFTIAKASPSKKGIRLSIEGVTTREASEALVGLEILMDKSQLPELETDTWYWEDLHGLEVIDHELGPLGIIDRLFSTGADDILVVKKGNQEILIPMNRHFVAEVDPEAATVAVTLPLGFIE